jgi:ring-1,2-phenylacetyl-CoA epoxidase subunit PaaC
MTATRELVPATRNALAILLLAMADDEFVIGFSDSEWTGIAPLLEEDVAMSSLAQDELGHARALYELLAEVVDDGRDADAIAYDRPAEGYFHARLLDHMRDDWAATIARRYLYDTADAIRLDALRTSSYEPLRELVAKIRREERYHLLHADTWLDRLATTRGEPRRRLLDALEAMGPDAGTVLGPLPTELSLEMAGVLDATSGELDARWRASIGPTFARLDLPMPPAAVDPQHARTNHSDTFRWLWVEFTSVRRTEPGAAW